jgi:hypothetical protein
MANQLGIVFAKLNCKPRWRERLPEIGIPTLVVHGRRNRFFPVGNGEAIAREIPGRRWNGPSYLSKHGDDLRNWAVFEPAAPDVIDVTEFNRDDPAHITALALHALTLE